MRSITLIEVDEENGHLYPGNRDMATHQVTALESIKDRGEGCIIADVGLLSFPGTCVQANCISGVFESSDFQDG